MEDDRAVTPDDPEHGYIIAPKLRRVAGGLIVAYAVLAGAAAGIGSPDLRETLFPILMAPALLSGLVVCSLLVKRTDGDSQRIWSAQKSAMALMIPAAIAFSVGGMLRSPIWVSIATVFGAGSGVLFIHQFVVAVKYYRGDNEGILELLDLLTVIFSVLALAGYVLVIPVIVAGFERRVPYALLPPVAVGFLIGIILLAASNKRNRRTAEFIFAAAGLFAFGSGLLESVAAIKGGDGAGPLWFRSAMWGGALGLIAVAPLWAPVPAEAPPPRSSLTIWAAPKLFLPYWSLLALPVLAVLALTGSRTWGPAYAFASTFVVFAFLVVRQLLTIRQNEGLFGEIATRDQERNALLARTIRAAEEERQRIARDLHDGPVQDLSALMLRMGRAAEKSTSTPEILLADLRDRLSAQVQAIRSTIAALRPPLLDKAGLVKALQYEVEEAFSRETTEVEFRAELTRKLSPDQELQLFRIAQEAVRNARTHSRADKVRVILEETADETVVLEVADNGIGFLLDQDALSIERGHIGLASMHERAGIAGATFQILSTPGAGTIVKARLSSS